MTRAVSVVLAAVAFAAFADDPPSVTNVTSNVGVLSNRVHSIVTARFVDEPLMGRFGKSGRTIIDDPSGRLVGTAEEAVLRAMAEANERLGDAARDASERARFEWEEYVRTNNIALVYINCDFAQRTVALASNLCGWVASQHYDGTNDHYMVWWNRSVDPNRPLNVSARVDWEGGVEWIEGKWTDWSTTQGEVDGLPCRELVVRRRNADCVLKTGSVITFGGKDGYDASHAYVNIFMNGKPAATTEIRGAFTAVTYDGTNRVVTTYADAFIPVENGFIKEINDEM